MKSLQLSSDMHPRVLCLLLPLHARDHSTVSISLATTVRDPRIVMPARMEERLSSCGQAGELRGSSCEYVK